MKKSMKRLMAFILLVCMLSTFFVPAAFADGAAGDGSAANTVTTTYDFELYNSTDAKLSQYTWADKQIKNTVKLADGTNAESYAGKTYEDLINDLYADSECSLNWGIHTNLQSSKFSNTTYNHGLYVYSTTVGSYMAFSLDAPVAESTEYTVSLNISRTNNKADVYLLQADADLSTALTKENRLFAVTASGNYTDTVTLSGEKLLLVVKITSTASKYYFGLKNLTLSYEEAPAETTAATQAGPAPGTVMAAYDFILYNAEQDDGYNNIFLSSSGTPATKKFENKCSCGCNQIIPAHLDTLYSQLGWQYLESTVSAGNIMFRETSGWGLRVTGTAGSS